MVGARFTINFWLVLGVCENDYYAVSSNFIFGLQKDSLGDMQVSSTIIKLYGTSTSLYTRIYVISSGWLSKVWELTKTLYVFLLFIDNVVYVATN